MHAQSFGNPASRQRRCSCHLVYKTRHITTPPETRIESETVQHERGGKLARAMISYPHLLLSGSTAAHIPAICDLLPQILHFEQHRLGQYLFLAHSWGTRIPKQGKKHHQARRDGLLSTKARSGKYYQSRMMKSHSARGAFITAISFLQRGRPSDSCMPPSVPDQLDQVQLQKSLNSSTACRGPRVMPGIHHRQEFAGRGNK